MTLAKNAFAILLAVQVAGCQARALVEAAGAQSRDPGAARFPSGTYTTCAQGEHNPDGNIFLNTAGFESGTVLTLSQSGTTVNATYVDQNGSSQSLRFTTRSATSASLAEPAQVRAGLLTLCVRKPGAAAPYPATMSVTAGAMTYNADTVFVTLTGSLVSEAGECGRLSQPDATFWLACDGRAAGRLAAGDAAAPPATQLPVGRYSCNSQIESYAPFNGIRNVAGGGATGTLTLAQDTAKASATYAGDSYLVGTLRFGLTTSTTAGAEAGQTLLTRCTIPMGRDIPSPTLQPLSIAAGSFTLVGSKLFVSFIGTLGSSCADAQVAGTLICSKQP
jgi:hypothetical protein